MDEAGYEKIARLFVDFYFKTFDENRVALGTLYRDDSMLTFEDKKVGGTAAIIDKLQNLPFQQVVHRMATLDSQPAHLGEGSILVLVTGELQVDGQEKPLSFTQSFQLKPEGDSFYVFNDIFRIVYPAS
ncbi:NTF2-like protein [Melanomma pulvis-pyrius CBS 109.77]|uniref:Nuclear transport factor 2 n=1 Tax=Melanomma pulvis-pyrius CBS 109.77 TaxID=1314802 RepID=A0A6A6XCE3_9PLEO|nr:NTF2-like protein [Melanomma pulvis-pyrius CBS 109.77]